MLNTLERPPMRWNSEGIKEKIIPPNCLPSDLPEVLISSRCINVSFMDLTWKTQPYPVVPIDPLAYVGHQIT